MADQAITALPKKTYSGSSQIASTDYLLGIDSAEGYQMLIQDLGEYIINRATASLAGSTQTLASAISALNSKMGDVRFYFYRGTNTEIELPATTNIGIIFIQSGNSGNIYTRYATTLVKYTANENNNVTFTMSGDNTISRTGNGIVRILYVYIP